MTDPDSPTDPETRQDDPVALFLLAYLAGVASADPGEVARAFAEHRAKELGKPVAWRPYFNTVKQQALNLARQGRLEVVRKGKPVDPREARGVVRYRLVRGDLSGHG